MNGPLYAALGRCRHYVVATFNSLFFSPLLCFLFSQKGQENFGVADICAKFVYSCQCGDERP